MHQRRKKVVKSVLLIVNFLATGKIRVKEGGGCCDPLCSVDGAQTDFEDPTLYVYNL